MYLFYLEFIRNLKYCRQAQNRTNEKYINHYRIDADPARGKRAKGVIALRSQTSGMENLRTVVCT